VNSILIKDLKKTPALGYQYRFVWLCSVWLISLSFKDAVNSRLTSIRAMKWCVILLRNEYRLPSDGLKIIFAELESQNGNFAIASPLEIAFKALASNFRLLKQTVTQDRDYKKLRTSAGVSVLLSFLHQISVRPVFNFNVRTFFTFCDVVTRFGRCERNTLVVIWACVKLKRNATRCVWLIVLCSVTS